jgi:hypothetical protein
MLVRAMVHAKARVKTKKDDVCLCLGNGTYPGQGQACGPKPR